MNELQKRAIALGLPKDSTIELIERAESVVKSLNANAKFTPSTLNVEARTIDVTFASENPVRTFSWEDGMVNEILSMAPGAMRMERINGGAPVLDNHNRYNGTSGVLGVVENARLENGVAVATLRFSKREDVEEVFQDIVDGILRGVSVGYRVHKYEITKEEGVMPVYRAVDWEPFEISMAPVQADILSQVRSNEEKIITNQIITMTDLEKRALAAGLSQSATLAEVERAEKENKERADKAVSDAVTAERTRSTEISDAVRSAGLPAEKAEKMIKDGITVDAARKLVIDAIAENNAEINGRSTTDATVGKDKLDKKREAMADALEHRANPSTELKDSARDFAGMTLLDMARESLSDINVATRGMNAREIAQGALNLSERGYMSSSDFPNLLASTVNRTLRKAYTLQGPTFTPFTNRGSFKDFRSKSVIQLGDVTKMKQVQEGGEYEYGNMPEVAENYKANKYGLIIPITWEAIINDDLGAFNRIPTSIANKARKLQADIVYGVLNSSALMADGLAIFSSGHNNLAGAGTVINTASLQAARTAMRVQKDVNGVDVLNLTPKYLVVGPAKELEAYQFTSSAYVPVSNGTINPVYNTQLTVIVDPRITGNAWYLIADPSQIDTIEYSFLEGEQELFTEKRMGWEVDGMEIKARMVFNAKAIDFRGMYKNPGA